MKALDKLLGGQQNLIGIVLLALLILVVFPLTLSHVQVQVVEDLALPVAAGQLVDLEHACFLSGPNTLR